MKIQNIYRFPSKKAKNIKILVILIAQQTSHNHAFGTHLVSDMPHVHLGPNHVSVILSQRRDSMMYV